MAFEKGDWYPPSHRRPTAKEGVVEIVVDNRTMLLGLDYMYREIMKRFEVEQLLVCAQEVCARLDIGPADCSVEGYYTESGELRRYFQLVRSLQRQKANTRARVQDLESFRLLEKVTSSSIFGRKGDESHLLPRSLSPLADALARPGQWSVKSLLERAQQIARGSDDHSLVGLAARAGDAVVMAALRETACLYEEVVIGYRDTTAYRYTWNADDEICRAANCFVEEFNRLVGDRYGRLPSVTPECAREFSTSAHCNDIVGRCVWIGQNPVGDHYYHWAVCMRREDEDAPGSLFVDEFWSREVWTTEQYRNLQRNKMEMKPIGERGGPHD